MIDFKEIELSDKKWADGLIAVANMRGCHQNFTNLFIWSGIYNQRVARVNDYLVIKGGRNGNTQRYYFPAGSGDIKPVILAMKQDAADCGHEFVLSGLSPGNASMLDTLFPGSFEYSEWRNGFDYVYYLDKLVGLPGRKLHAKRNHINYFKKNNNWKFEPVTLKNLDECRKMNEEWYIVNNYKDDNGLMAERTVVERCFENFSDLGLEGGMLSSDGRIIAYTMGEILNSDTYVIHVEKAFSDIRGAYQMINREFASMIQEKHSQIVYVNREDDMGNKGLRKAKLSYFPDKMEEKYTARYIGERVKSGG